MSKRSNYISWDEYFMGIALLSGEIAEELTTKEAKIQIHK